MYLRYGRAVHTAALAVGILVAMAACSNTSNGSNAVPIATATPSNSVVFSVSASGSTQTLPQSTGTITFGPATTGGGTQFTLQYLASQPSTAPALGAGKTPLQYFSFSDPSNVTFSGFPAIAFVLPASISTTSVNFYLALLDPKTPGTWQAPFAGPATVNGQNVTFAAGSTPFAMTGGSTYNFALYSVSNAAPTPPPPAFIYVSNHQAASPNRNTIQVFPASSSGNVLPFATIATGANNPNGLAFGPTGILYAANGAGSITEYTAGASGPATALSTTITSPTLTSPQMIAVDSSGKIYVTQDSPPADSVQVYAANASGVSAPIATISGAATGLSTPQGIALDSASNIWVANSGNNTVTEYAAGSNGNVAPIATIGGATTTLSSPTGIAIDSAGNIDVTNATGSILIFKTGTVGNTAPTSTIGGSATLLNGPAELYLDSLGKLYVANGSIGASSNGSILTFPSSANGNVAPTQAISSDSTGDRTGLAQPFGVAVR
ncbi:MAG: NHL repeat-containing protein [Candidatus Eremiobacteraeota bacterium]|nr:NHL repeat-containing protein [Candidatus Eremiobacteraeota bacterium]